MAVKKRFIAGATCPSCGEMDSIVVYEEEGEQKRECVSCDFAEVANFTGERGDKELPTRVNQAPIEKIKLIE